MRKRHHTSNKNFHSKLRLLASGIFLSTHLHFLHSNDCFINECSLFSMHEVGAITGDFQIPVMAIVYRLYTIEACHKEGYGAHYSQ